MIFDFNLIEDFIDNLSLPWTIERGLLAGINIILDIGNHLLGALYKICPKTYGEVIKELYLKNNFRDQLFQNQRKGKF